METKLCYECQETKPLDDFYDNNKGGKRNKCRPCHIRTSKLSKTSKTSPEKREEWLKHIYGISNLDYNKMLLNQNGLCAICGVSQLELETVLVVDHHHDSGEVRELLCHSCNSGLGMYRENPNLFSKASQYLTKHNKKENKSS